ncbi:MAG: Rnase Y domain-containing protein, partial [Candidatus Omnitrophota bacterium]|nr:Rnase Y domain-containing protein [Candidatus Omnitrophota bacterium]
MTIFIYIIAALVSISSGYALNKVLSRKKIQDAKQAASQILEQTKKEVENLKKEAELEGKDMILRLRQDFEAKTQSRREELIALEKRLSLKEDNVDRRLALLEKKEKELDAKYDSLRINEDALKAKDKQLAALINEEKERLQKIANLTIEEGKQVLLARLSDELNNEKAVLIRNCEEEIKTTADKRARELISLAVQRCAVEHTVESTVSVVSLPSDEM